jgi:hypothetical protein
MPLSLDGEVVVINFIQNDPLATGADVREVAARPDRKSDQAGFSVSGNEPERVYDVGTAGFVRWQARQGAILAIEAWEEAIGERVDSWAQEVPDPSTLLLMPDGGTDLNAFYDRESLSFFHDRRPSKTTFSGESVDVVAHETGHALLDALRPDLWFVNLLEVGAAHEAFGDCFAIVTALSDRDTRTALLAASPDLGTPNFVEATAEDLSDGVLRARGPMHPASKPRRALNSFRWQLPETMSVSGGPDEMIAEVHSMARILSGCFYDLLRNLFAASAAHREADLWAATRLAAQLLRDGLANAPEVPRFFRSVGRQMVLADLAKNGGVNGAAIGQAFARHGIALGARALLAPELALEGRAPRLTASAASVQKKTIADLRRRLGIGNAPVSVSALDVEDTTVAKVSFHVDVPLDGVDDRLRGVVCPVNVPALVGESGGVAALLNAPRRGTSSEEAQQFVRVLIANDQLAFDSAATEQRPSHAVRERDDGRKELRRLMFAC